MSCCLVAFFASLWCRKALQKKKDKQQDCAEDGALSVSPVACPFFFSYLGSCCPTSTGACKAMECSNLPYYQAIVEMCHAVVACGVLRRFSADDAQVTFEVTAGLATGQGAFLSACIGLRVWETDRPGRRRSRLDQVFRSIPAPLGA